MRLSLAFLLVLTACNDDSSGGGDGGGNQPGDDGGGPQPCTGEFCPDAGPPGDDNCKKVDLVFAVDNSSSMSEEKDALANDVFPAFATALLTVGGGLDDYRVGVLD